MKQRVTGIILIIILIFGLVGCQSKDASLLGNYRATDTLIHSDVGALVTADFAPLTSQWFLCDITEDMQTEDYVFDSENANRDGTAFVIDRTNNKLLFGYHMLNKRFPASLTKLMTALLVLKNCDLLDTITITPEIAALKRGSNAVLEEGDQMTISSLLGCLLVVSANNVGVALAEYLAGSEEAFVEMMNDEAKKLGLSQTQFANPHGMHDDKHFTTPYDMYVVLQECLKYDEFVKWSGITRTSYEYIDKSGSTRTRVIESTNQFKLGNYEYPEGITILGGKTGTTAQAGYCLMMHVANEEGHEYILGVYHAETEEKLYNKMSELMSSYCFQ